MFLVPDSFGVLLREFNPCHDSEDGKFTFKGRGRCLGDAARLAARRDSERTGGIFSDTPEVRATRILTTNDEDERKAVRKLARARRAVRLFNRKNPAPGYMQRDIQRATRADSAVTMVEPPTSHTRSPGYAEITGRSVSIEPRPGDRRSYLLSVLRHEHGHVDRTPLGRGGSTLNGVKLDKRQTEEIRAWKNAIRNSEGKVGMTTMHRALSTYFIDHPEVIARTNARAAEMAKPWADRKPTRTEAVDFLQGLIKAEAQGFVREKIMPALTRYTRRVRRASKQAA